MFHKSIRFRIQFWHSLLLVATTIGLSISYYFYEKQNQLRLIDDKLHNSSISLLPQIERFVFEQFPEEFPRRAGTPQAGNRRRPPPNNRDDQPPRNAEEREENLTSHIEKAQVMAYAWSRDLDPVYQSTNANIDIPELTLSKSAKAPNIIELENLRMFTTATLSGAVFGFAVDIRPHRAALASLRRNLATIDLLIISLGISIGWYLTGQAIRPIHRINATAKQIANGQRNQRIDSSVTDCELGQLAEVLNNTFDKLDHSFDQQVKFTADASHELRTPVAALLSQTQLALARDRSIEEYKHHLQACQNQATHMRELLNSLLDLARSDSGETEFRFADYDLAELVMETCEWQETLAAKKNVRLQTKLPPTIAQIDGLRFSQVLSNIISNAIQHSPESGDIRIDLTSDANHAHIEISDQGPGIPEDSIPHIFDRFYRASKSRSSTHGSVGLGLAIAKAIVDKHHGNILARTSPTGSTFTISIPLSH